jgi:uncharacterized protein YceK
VIKHNVVSWIAVAVAVLIMTGCASVPVLTVTSEPVNAPRQVSAQDVEVAITRAGKILGWQMAPKGSGQLEGTLQLRTHKAVIDITYDASAYSIKYKDSSNLDYDGANINRGYNRWIKSLNDTIKAQFKAL